MRTTLLALLLGALTFAATPQTLASQTATPNAVYVELLGSGGLFSLNYERRVSSARVRIGVGSWTASDLFGAGEEAFVVLPLTLSHVSGRGNHHLESGAGVTVGNSKFTSSFDGTTTRSGFVTLTGLVGYRYQKPGSGFIFRALFTPLYGLGEEAVAYPDRGFFPSIGISLGAAF